MNDLELYFESNAGRLIHKWTHYFEIYDRHFSRFRNTEVCIVEIGIFHGGSLQMWRNYFGPQAKIIGIDIDPRCKEFEEEGIEIIIGDQADRNFLASIKERFPKIDILLDDGGHTMPQQITTFESLFSCISETGIYLCEDLHTSYWSEYGGGFRSPHSFIEYSKRFIDYLNAWHSRDPESFRVTDFTRSVYSMHYYDSILVIEKRPISPPCDRMTGHPSFADLEITPSVQEVASGETLKFEINGNGKAAQNLLVQLNAKYAEASEKYLLTQNHASNLEQQLQQVFSEVQAAQNHASNLEQALQVTRNHVENLETQLQFRQEHIGTLEEQLKAAQLNLQMAQVDMETAQVELEKFQRTKVTVRQLKHELLEAQTELEHKQTELIHTQLRLSAFENHFHTAQAQLNQKKEKIQFLRSKIEHKHSDLLQAQERITAMESSKFWQLRNAWIKLKRKVGLTQETTDPFMIVATDQKQLTPTKPEKQKQPELAPAQNQSSSDIPQPTPYEQWIQHNTPQLADLKRMAEIAEVFAYKPVISIIVPVYNTPEAYLREAIDSVLAQIYPHWELCLADDASTEPHVREVLEEYAMADSRIKVVFREQNGHISASSNSALELATGDYIALLDHDDTLALEALYEVTFLLNRHPEADMIYSDEDKLDEAGKRKDPFFKPDWCPDSFLSRMYTCHLGVYRRSIINEIGGFRLGFEGGQDYDLVLRFTEKTDRIFHIPKVLYHWRVHSGSVASASSAKPYAYRAAEKAIAEAHARRGEAATVIELDGHPGCYITRYKIADPKLVSIIIPTRDLGHMVNQCLESIFTKSTYPNYEVILIDNGSTEKYTEKVISEWLNREPDRFRCYALGIPFNYSKINNFAVTKAKGDFLLFLNNDTEVIAPDWIEAMVEQAQRPSIGAVGALLYYPDDTVQHAGVVLGIGSVAGHSHKYFKSYETGYFSQIITINNYSAVTGACLMCRREVFEEIEGFNEEFAVAFNDIDLCLKMLDKGYHNIYVPHAKLYHHESKSRGYDTTPEKQIRFLQEAEKMKKRWQYLIEQDPCYSPNLTATHENYSIREYEDSQQRELMNKLRQTQKRVKRLQTQLEQVREEKDQAIGRVEAMETSKFWKLRKRWFKLKTLVGIPGHE